MRHGNLSDIHGSNLSSAASASGSEGTHVQCPVKHYSNLFAAGTTAKRGSAALDRNAIAEIADARSSGVDDPPKDDRDNIPAGYTYFGQLVVHDLTQSIAGSGQGGASVTLQNLMTPNLDLDTIYGGGPTQCPHLYQAPYEAGYLNRPQDIEDDGQYLFHLGRTAKAALPENWEQGEGLPYDLPRAGAAGGWSAGTSITPLVRDARNDDNLILAQLTAQFMLVHNRVARYLHHNGDPADANRPLSKKESFELARHFVLIAYRRIVVHDYLQLLLLPAVYGDLKAGKIASQDHLPIEFVFGAARVGHAMVRAAYTINNHIGLGASGLGRLMSFSSSSPGANLPLPADWVVDWRQLLEMDDGEMEDRVTPQSARRISPFLAPTFVHSDLKNRRTDFEGSLSFHDLWRCYQFEIPTGQECARQLFGSASKKILTQEDMLPRPAFSNLHPAEKLTAALQAHPEFLTETPLSYYLLQEAAVLGGNGRYLGPLGSHIFAAAILYALKKAPQTYATPAGQRGLDFDRILKPTGIVKLPHLLKVPAMPDADLAEVIVKTLA
ncbi:peroxidase family protein [Dongia deserti]|uniref:peroxidase family protein n=1 Tax=Dongia deserti TaxID=2268030 RepID=UPI0013C47D17|nr:peroxidase family protein [Dongia deserti]